MNIFLRKKSKILFKRGLTLYKAENKNDNKVKFKLPSLDLLKTPLKKKEKVQSKMRYDPEFLEKILLDFGVNGNIKKVSHGPVVTLNEFEPAAGVKVSKIINLSDDIARNTSSSLQEFLQFQEVIQLVLSCQIILEKMFI